MAIQCSWKDIIYQKTHSFLNAKTILGPNMTKSRGVFYLETEAESPFAISDHKMFKNSGNTSDKYQLKQQKNVD